MNKIKNAKNFGPKGHARTVKKRSKIKKKNQKIQKSS